MQCPGGSPGRTFRDSCLLLMRSTKGSWNQGSAFLHRALPVGSRLYVPGSLQVPRGPPRHHCSPLHQHLRSGSWLISRGSVRHSIERSVSSKLVTTSSKSILAGKVMKCKLLTSEQDSVCQCTHKCEILFESSPTAQAKQADSKPS